jgi:RNA polymerase sigma-70 factor, ECF subfamily
MGALWDKCYNPADAKTIEFKVRTLIGRYGYRKSDSKDLEQRLAIRVWKAMRNFDPAKATRSTFLKTVLDNEVANIVEHDTAQKRDQRKEKPPTIEDDGPPDQAEAGQLGVERRLDVPEMIARLPANLQSMAKLLMEMTVAEASRLPGMTRGKVRQQAAEIARSFREFGWDSE